MDWQLEKIIAGLLYLFIFIGPWSFLFLKKEGEHSHWIWTLSAAFAWFGFLAIGGLLFAMRIGAEPLQAAVTLCLMALFFLWPIYLPKFTAKKWALRKPGFRKSIFLILPIVCIQVVPVVAGFWVLRNGLGDWLNEGSYRFFTEVPK